MNSRMRNFIIFLGIIGICLCITSIAAYVMSGIITLLGLVFLIENSRTLKGIAYRCNRLIDVAIFAFGIYCKINLGVTIGMAMVFAGLGYSMIYGPYIRDTYKLKSK